MFMANKQQHVTHFSGNLSLRISENRATFRWTFQTVSLSPTVTSALETHQTRFIYLPGFPPPPCPRDLPGGQWGTLAAIAVTDAVLPPQGGCWVAVGTQVVSDQTCRGSSPSHCLVPNQPRTVGHGVRPLQHVPRQGACTVQEEVRGVHVPPGKLEPLRHGRWKGVGWSFLSLMDCFIAWCFQSTCLKCSQSD